MLKVLIIVVGLGLLIGIVRMIHNNIFTLRKTFPWMALAIGIMVVAIFPETFMNLAYDLGFKSAMNFLFFSAIVFLFAIELINISARAKVERQTKELIQEVSLLKHRVEELERETNHTTQA